VVVRKGAVTLGDFQGDAFYPAMADRCGNENYGKGKRTESEGEADLFRWGTGPIQEDAPFEKWTSPPVEGQGKGDRGSGIPRGGEPSEYRRETSACIDRTYFRGGLVKVEASPSG